jgi:uncharacterized Ntn-hydrolase superfamily protein
MSAALLVVAGEPADSWAGRLVDVRVDRSADPLGELDRLCTAADAFTRFGQAADALSAGDASSALASVDAGLAELPGEENLLFLRAGALLASGNAEQARAELRTLLARRPALETLVRSFAAKGLLMLPPGTSLDALLA